MSRSGSAPRSGSRRRGRQGEGQGLGVGAGAQRIAAPIDCWSSSDDAAAAIDYYARAFGAKELGRMDAPGGKIGHAELQIGDSRLMLADALPQSSTRPPKELGGTSASIFLYVEDVDAVVRRAVDAG